MKNIQPTLRLVLCRDSDPKSKYEISRSTCLMPGLPVVRRPIFSSVRSGTPLPVATSSQRPLEASSLESTCSNMVSLMGSDYKPVFGSMQPAHGFKRALGYLPMPRGTKKRKTATLTRAVVADNVQGLMDSLYAGNPNKVKALAIDSGLSLSTVQRILNKEVGASVDNLESLAKSLGCSVGDLVTADDRMARALGIARPDGNAQPVSRQRRA